jgi:hypothetical protein
MKYENKTFSVPIGDTKAYRDNYDKIDWGNKGDKKKEDKKPLPEDKSITKTEK